MSRFTVPTLAVFIAVSAHSFPATANPEVAPKVALEHSGTTAPALVPERASVQLQSIAPGHAPLVGLIITRPPQFAERNSLSEPVRIEFIAAVPASPAAAPETVTVTTHAALRQQPARRVERRARRKPNDDWIEALLQN